MLAFGGGDLVVDVLVGAWVVIGTVGGYGLSRRFRS